MISVKKLLSDRQLKIISQLVFKIIELGFLEDRVEIKSHSVKTIDGSVEHHSRVGEQRCMNQAAASAAPDEQRCTSQATRTASEPTWASTDLLKVIEEVPYHELFFHNFEELVPRSWAVREFFISGCHM